MIGTASRPFLGLLARLATLVLTLVLAPGAAGLDLSGYRMVDLSHSFNQDTLYWPTSPTRFEKQEIAYGKTEGGWFYSAFSVCLPEHGGTHLDAPLHFAEGAHATDEMPLSDLIAPAVVIDVTAAAAKDRDYRLTVADLAAHEKRHGKIAPGTIVILKTGWSRYWPQAKAYLGDDTRGDASKLSFPSYGAEATKILVEERRVVLLGVDTASIDYGKSQDFPVHRISAARNVGGLENLTNLDQLPATGAYVIALPMKIEGGSGGPVRVVALVPQETDAKD
ncbi:MAG: cyclase family protein [Acidobacteriota bacterium]